MTRADHSPGPWAELDDISIADANGVKVAVVYDGSERQLIGNRQLVTAGPELLDLVKRMARRLDSKATTDLDEKFVDEAKALVRRIEAPGGRLNT